MKEIKIQFDISEKLCEYEVVESLEYNKIDDKYDELIIRDKTEYHQHYPECKGYSGLVVVLEEVHI